MYTVLPVGLTERVSIPFTYQNGRDQPLYHPTCRPSGGKPTVNLSVQKLVDGRWVEAWTQALPQCLSEPVVIEAGGTFSDTLELILHPQDTLLHPLLTPLAPLDGPHRLVWHDLLSSYNAERYPFGEPIPLWERLSGTFELRR